MYLEIGFSYPPARKRPFDVGLVVQLVLRTPDFGLAATAATAAISRIQGDPCLCDGSMV